MKIGILGAGAVGAVLAELMAGAGHAVMVSSSHPERLGGTAEAAGCAVGTVEQACAFGACVAALPLGGGWATSRPPPWPVGSSWTR